MNEPSSPPPSAQSITLPLRSLQDNCIIESYRRKREMHPSHNKAYLENLWTEIEMLQWVFAQILTPRRQQSSAAVKS